MRGITYTKYGGPEVTSIGTVPTPTAGPGQLLIRTVAGGLNPVDKLQRSGMFKLIMPYTLPVVAGNEFSGRIASIGPGVDPSGSAGWAVGDDVICRVEKSGLGALGEYVVQPASIVSRAPKSIPLVDAAGLPLAGLTAAQCLDLLDVKQGDRVLITGGAGGVGLFAIQLAKLRGAVVVTTASEAGRSYVEKAGADVVVDYRSQKLAEMGEKFHKVFDVAGGEEALVGDVIPAMAKGGHIMSIAGPLTAGRFDDILPWYKKPIINFVLGRQSAGVLAAATKHGVRYDYHFMRPDGPQLQGLADLVDAGKLVVNIDSRFTFDDYKQAYERLESGRSKGKVVIEFPQDA